MPFLITGNRTSTLNPLHVRVPWYTARAAQSSSSLGPMFGLVILYPPPPVRSTISAGTGTAASRKELQQVGCAASLRPPHRWAARFPLPLTARLTRCRCLPPSASLPPSPALPSFLSHLHTQLSRIERAAFTCWLLREVTLWNHRLSPSDITVSVSLFHTLISWLPICKSCNTWKYTTRWTNDSTIHIY